MLPLPLFHAPSIAGNGVLAWKRVAQHPIGDLIRNSLLTQECLRRSAQVMRAHVRGDATMKHCWVKAIGKKLREDLGDCPTLPQELVDALRRLEQARQASSVDGQSSFSKASATMQRARS
jgi:hypothetical protein